MSGEGTLPNELTVVGPGRIGSSIAEAAAAAGLTAHLCGRELPPDQIEGKVVLLCVPDSAITEVAGDIASSGCSPAVIGHTSGASPLTSLESAKARDGEFLFHPLQTFLEPGTPLDQVPVAISGTTEEAAELAANLARTLGGIPFAVPEETRAAYHAAASIGSNFLVTLEESAAELLERAGVTDSRQALAPLLRTTLENWIERGSLALTGPIVRGDEETVSAHREALASLDPEMLVLYDVLAERTRQLAARVRGETGGSGDADSQ